ncbi:MAG: tRNA preQ1(34) S-adenosylmethionine ribosyltransferase-isomerase QueA [Kordiimonas sp.]|nr:tRNA preQ1(34) S-adenosylmethionine ribosyltransferase-isomerase QueA [Kordiimonas sp.]
MKVDQFDFDLPKDLIALRPVAQRDRARLLIVQDQQLEDRIVTDLTSYLKPGDVLVFNNTRVIPARLTGRRGNAKVEITLHMCVSDDCWKAFARPAKKLRIGDTIVFADTLSAQVTGKGDAGEVTVTFDKKGHDLRDALEDVGVMPLPPYIAGQRPVDAQDLKDYQTVYGKKDGAVAAPTAGLHFTDQLLAATKNMGIKHVELTLHVGAGTFLPVKVEDTEDHKMHAEWGEISEEAAKILNEARREGGRIISVGTTSLRLLESAVDANGIIQPFTDTTSIFITPGYDFKAVDILMTNFHLPRSTLFMLVSAFAGFENMKAAYQHAIAEKYRFYSYGDSSLLFRHNS